MRNSKLAACAVALAAAMAACNKTPAPDPSNAAAAAAAAAAADASVTQPASGTDVVTAGAQSTASDTTAAATHAAGTLLDSSGNPIALLPFDIDSVPMSTASLGDLPFFSLPDGYGPVNRPRQTGFARFPFRLGEGLHWVEGASWNSLIRIAPEARSGKEYSQLEVRRIEAPVALLVGDDISTDEILPAGARVLPFRSSIPELARFTFDQVDETYSTRAAETRDTSGHIIIAGANYGQGSSREHAAITPRFLGLRAVLAVAFARIHWQNLANFGVLALEFPDATDHGRIRRDDVLVLEGIREALATKTEITVHNKTRNENYATRQNFSQRQIDMLLAGGLISWLQERRELS